VVRREWGQGGEMNQALYAHMMNKRKRKKINKKSKWLKKICMKKCSISLAIKKMQVKTMLRFHFTPVRMATIKNTNNNKC
jgi:hypothetical protein